MQGSTPELPQREEQIEVHCPFCTGKVHSFPIVIEYSLVVFSLHSGQAPKWPEMSKPFTRIFVCPDTGKNFEAQVTIDQQFGETVEGIST